ncbi:MAG: hypothetical protein ACAH89_08575, partial [Rariglobus sp.]
MIVSSVAPRRKSGPRAGFALLITVTLLAFLVLLLVSLASLTRVETQVAANSQQLSQARQNALTALNIALGELQKYAGPDQRTTARSDMDAALVNTSVKSGRWIGVYGSGVSANYADIPSIVASKIAADAASGPANGSQARLLNWLVSGNEGTAFDPGSAVAADGRISTAPSAFAYKPADAVANIASAPTVGGKEARLLVGPGTVGTAVNDYVAAPLVNIDAAAGQISGLSGTATIGRYAWWVGDENAKARINLPLTQDSVQRPRAFVSAARAAVELVDGVNAEGAAATAPASAGTNRLTSYDPSAPASADAIPRLLSSNQLDMLGTTSAAVTALTTARKYRFHDLTAASSSVLSDTYAGGLKKDLSALLATGAASPAGTDYLFTPEPSSQAWINNSQWVPTWGQLRSYASDTVPADGKLQRRLPTATQVGIAPVLTYAGAGFRYISAGGVGAPINLAVFPIAVLWNPYTTPIKGAKYEMGVARVFSATIQLQASTPTKTSPWTVKETRDFNKGGVSIPTPAPGTPGTHADGSADITSTYSPYPGPTAAGPYWRFVIDASDVDLAPGQSMIFTLPSAAAGQPYDAPETGTPKNELKKGLRPPSSAYAVMPSISSVQAGEVNFRVGIYSLSAGPAGSRTLFSPATQDAHFSGSECSFYLGEVASAAPAGRWPDPNPAWYQSFSRIYGSQAGTDPVTAPSGSSTRTDYSVLQGGLAGAPLDNIAPEPLFMISMRTIFSDTDRGISGRWIAQGNFRAQVNTRNRLDQTNLGIAGIADGAKWKDINVQPSGVVSSGAGLDSDPATTDTALFEIRPADQPLLSLGQLQHANLSLLQTYPSYPIGNSLADYRFKGTSGDFLAQVVRTDGGTITEPNLKYFTPAVMAFYDLSYLLNRALWDRYFVSTVPHAGTGTSTDTNATDVPDVLPLPNPRNVRQVAASDDDLRDESKAAAGLMVSGGFNINSTSEQAWRAVLGGINKLVYDPVTPANPGSPLQAALPRFSKPTATADANSASWQGYRQLTEPQIAELARKIVSEVRNRGPFVSMGDFVNRRLRDNPATTSATFNANETYKGAIQNAIDASGTFTAGASGSYTVTGTTAVNTGSAAAFSAASPFTVKKKDNTLMFFGGGAYTDVSLMHGGPAKVAPYSSQSAFAPQFLTQADVLSAIGSGLSARSDTFVIRTCGESVNPVLASTDAGYVTGRVWCEAVVQRVVEPLRRKSTDAVSPDYNEPAAASAGLP